MLKINLLDDRRKDILARQFRIARFNLLAIILAAVAGLMAIGAGMLNFYYEQQLNQVQAQKETLESEVLEYSDIFASMQIINSKLASIKKIFVSRAIATEKLGLFFELVDEGVLDIKSVGFGGVSAPLEFELSGVVNSLAEFIELNLYIKQISTQKDFESIMLQSLTKNDDGSYSVTYLMKFNDTPLTRKLQS